MFSLPQLRRVICFEQIHNSGHFVDGIFAKLRRRTMRGLAARFQIQPQASFVSGDNLQPRRLTDDGHIRFESACGQCARAGLCVLLVNQSGENNFCFEWSRL